jgi:hypothetical protein
MCVHRAALICLQLSLRTEVKRLLCLRLSTSESFWTHIGRNHERILSRQSDVTDTAMTINRCLRYKHSITTIAEALITLDSWHDENHRDNGICGCDACSDAQFANCLHPTLCRNQLISTMDLKTPEAWDGQSFPDWPDDTSKTARSVYLFTFAWDGMIKTPFDQSMRALVVAHFKRISSRYKTVPDEVIDTMLLTYAQSLHRQWQTVQRRFLEQQGSSPATIAAVLPEEGSAETDDDLASDEEMPDLLSDADTPYLPSDEDMPDLPPDDDTPYIPSDDDLLPSGEDVPDPQAENPQSDEDLPNPQSDDEGLEES